MTTKALFPKLLLLTLGGFLVALVLGMKEPEGFVSIRLFVRRIDGVYPGQIRFNGKTDTGVGSGDVFDFTAFFEIGSRLSLFALTNPNYRFDHWEGPGGLRNESITFSATVESSGFVEAVYIA